MLQTTTGTIFSHSKDNHSLGQRSTSLPSRSRRQKDIHLTLTPHISQSSINISQVPDIVIPSTPIVTQPIMHKPNLQRTLFSPIPPRSQSLPPKPPPVIQTLETSTPPRTTLINPLLNIPKHSSSCQFTTTSTRVS